MKRSFRLVFWLVMLVAWATCGYQFAVGQNSISTGLVGPRGYTGPRGPAGIFSLGTVTTGAPGTPVVINNVGTASNAVLNITIPRGSAFFNGSGAPPASTGLMGDYYIDTAAGCLYGPRTDAGWPSTCQNFAGAPGPQGPAGPTGPQGPPGQDGASSSVGNPGDVQVVGATAGSFAPGTNVAIPVTNGMLNSDKFLTNPTSNDGVANALASSYCNPGPCSVTRNAATTDNTYILPLPPTHDTLYDKYGGSGTVVVRNPGVSHSYRLGRGYDAWGIATSDAVTAVFDNTLDNTSNTPDLARPSLRISAGIFSKLSWNYGNCPNCGSVQWGPAGGGSALDLYFDSSGITQARTSNSVKHATGDWSSFYAYFYSDGGQPDYSGEGGNNVTIEGGENNDYFHGTVGAGASAGTQSLPIVYNSSITTVNRNATSADAFMLDISQGTGQMHVTGPDQTLAQSSYVGILPIDTAVIPSTAYGNTGCEMAVPVGTNPSKSGSITCTINNIGGTTKQYTAGLAELSGDFPEMVTITNVGAVSGTSQPVTFTYVHPHGSGQTMLWQGSNVIGTYLSYDQYYNINNFRTAFHVYGATDSTHIAAQPRAGGVVPNPYIAPITVGPLTQSGTTVTANAANVQIYGQYNLQPAAVVSGCSDAGFNQNVTNLKMNIGAQTFTWTSPGTGSTCTSATLSMPTSLFAFHLYPGAEQYGPAIAAPNNLPLEPNNVNWTQGDLIEMPHHFDWSGSDLRTTWQIVDPLAQYSGNSNGVSHTYFGAGIGGQFKPFNLGIANPCSYYIGCGGTMNLGPMMVFGTGGNPANGGVNGGGMRLGEAPINGQPVISVGCQDVALGGCSNHDPILFSMFSAVANSQMYFYSDTVSYGASNFEAGSLGQRGYGQFKGGRLWLDGIQQSQDGITFSYDGTTKTAQISLCQYNTDKLVVGNCNTGTSPNGQTAPDGVLYLANLNAQGTSNFGILNVGLTVPQPAIVPTYTGTAGTTQRQYNFVAVDPVTGIETPVGVHSNPISTAATLDASDYVSIPCPAVIQGNYPAGTTYRVYETFTVKLIGNCPVGTTIKDTGAGTAQYWSIRNDGGVLSAGRFAVEAGGSIAFWNNPTFASVIDTYLTRSASGALRLGTTKGGSDGSFTTGTFNGSGAGLTGIPDSSLSSNIARLNVANTFTAAQTFDAVNANSITSSVIKVVGQDVCQKNGTNCPNFFVNYGRATLVGGTVTVSTSSSSSSYIYDLTNCGVGGTQGMLSIGTITPNVSFVINSSSATDTSVVCWAAH